MSRLTYEEQSLIACFNTTSREGAIAAIEGSLLYLNEDKDMKVLAQKTLQKIKGMTDLQFESFVLSNEP